MMHTFSLSKIFVFLAFFFSLFFFLHSTFSTLPQNAHALNSTLPTLNPSVTVPPSFVPSVIQALTDRPTPPNIWVYPTEKPDYYKFAHDNLFDNQDFFYLQGTTIYTPIPGLDIKKVGPNGCDPCKVPNKTNITFTITVTYSRDQSIAITDVFPPNTKLAGKPSGDFPDISATQVVWHLTKEKENPSFNTPTWIFTITLQPTQDNIAIKNIVDATIEGGSMVSPTPTPSGGGPQPTVDPNANKSCSCYTPYGMPQSSGLFNTPQNNYQCIPVPANEYCKSNFNGVPDSYCDPTKSGDAKPPVLGTPCTQVSNCTCNDSTSFTCNNGHNTYNQNCPNGHTCDSSIKQGIPCK